MDPVTWKALNRLLDEALDLPPEERGKWLEELSSEHEVLKPRLRALLAHAETGAKTPLGTLPKLDTRGLADTSGELEERVCRPGQDVGPYRLERLLGEGGMGSVWLAERTDGLVQRAVALKLPHVLGSRPELAQRLAREREILASLNHPHIARLYDAGLTDEGQPYLALEYVEGIPIDVYAREHELDIHSRLRLFLQIAEAVAHAHAQLVVHRDIKPSNILVTKDGRVHLLDFGIAKLLEDGHAQETELTRVSGRALTLAYASPEQVSGEPLGVGSDVYSLGVVLYELLTGSRPYEPSRSTRGALEDAILHTDPQRPSEVAGDPTFRRTLRGDLDTILLKALKKEPQERYTTTNTFAEDIERYLEGRPVLAQPDSAPYRLRKFVGRNRLAVGAAAAILVTTIVGAGLALWQARVAVVEKERAEEVKDFVVSIFEDADPYTGDGVALTAADLLVNADQRIRESFNKGSELRIELLGIVGSSLNQLQQYDSAAGVLDQAVSEAQRTLGEKHPQTLRARVARSTTYRYLGKTKEMQEELALVLPELERNPLGYQVELIDAIENQAHLAIDEGRYDDAEAAAKRAFDMATSALGERHHTTAELSRLLAVSYRYTKKIDLAVDAAEYAFRLNLDLRQGNGRHPSVIDARATYGISLADRGQLDEAIVQFGQAVDDAAALFGTSSAMVGFFSGRLAGYREQAGDIRRALENAETHLSVLTELAAPDSFTYASTVAGHGTIVLAARRGEEALSQLTLAVDMLERALGPSHEEVYRARVGRALALGYTGKGGEAQIELAALVEHYRSSDDTALARALFVRGVVARLDGDYTQALSCQREALEAIRPGPNAERFRMGVLAEIGLDLLDLGDLDQAGSAFEDALARFEAHQKLVSPARADVLLGYGRLKMRKGQPLEALPLLGQADTFWRELDAENRWAGEAAWWLGQCYSALGRTVEAETSFSRARKILSRSPIPTDEKLVEIARGIPQ